MFIFERRIRKLIQKKGDNVVKLKQRGKMFNGWFMPDGTDKIVFVGDNEW